MEKKRWLDAGIAGALILGSLILYGKAREFPMGSDIFPKFMLITVIFLSVLMLVNALWKKRPRPKASTSGPSDLPNIVRPYALFLCIVGYVIFMIVAGFFPATMALGVILIPVLDVARRKLYSGILVGAILFVYFLFVHFLNVPLPKGILFD